MSTLTRKQVAFDLNTNELKKFYPSNSWNKAYEDIKIHMTANGYRWQQGSVYVSKFPMSMINASKILSNLVRKFPWLNVCMRDCTITNISKEYSQKYIFDKNADVPIREES